MNDNTSETIIIDRIEGEIVVVEINGDRMQDIPKSSIEGQFKEGDILVKGNNGKLRVDEELTKQRREEMAKKLKRLFNK